MLDQPPIETDVSVSHDESVCPLVDGTASAHGHCWRIESDASDLSALENSPLSDVDVSSLISSKEVFLEGRRCRLNISFETDPKERKGIVFRESKRIARALNLRPVNLGTFLSLDSEQLQVVLTSDYGGIQVSVFSSITGERVSSGALIPPEGKKWDIDEIIEGFVAETEEFLQSYFENDERPEEHIIDYQEMLDDLRFKLKRLKKGLPLR
ncbi:MAG: hypothetical protein ACE5H4_01740 [Candidatus Thorarchaeota archaeon]